MHLQSASQLENWVWYLYLQIPSFRKIVTRSRPTRKVRACLLSQLMVYHLCSEIGMDGSKTSGVFPVSLMRRSYLPLCSSLGGLLVKLLAGREMDEG